MEILNFYFCLYLGFAATSFGHNNAFKMLNDDQGEISDSGIIEKVIAKCNESVICKSQQDFSPGAICGSDGRTYSNPCELKKAHCYGNFVSEQHKGTCSECEPDGSYSTIQCHNSTGYCWCSTNAGTPVPGTTVKNKKPYCPPRGKVGRRSSHRRLTKNGKGCTTLDRSTFNYNLIRYFRQEFEEEAKKKNQHIGLISTKQVIEWKFSRIDSDKNNKISMREIKMLKKLAKELISPRVCARRLWDHCDSDRNARITRSEWFLCLGVDINAADKRQNSLLLALASGLAETPSDNRGRFLLSEKPIGQMNLEDSQEEDKAPPADCSVHRRRTLEEYKMDPSGAVYVPACSVLNGSLNDPVQCHASTGFCWCVEPAGGKPVPGTSLQNVRPNCGPNSASLKHLSEIKECTGNKKRLFFTRLLATMESNMISRGGDSSEDEKSRDEIVVYWQFKYIDRNNNTRIDRPEWREYRNVLKTWIGVRKCGRNFLRYCDQNSDQRISMPEWLDCTLRNIQAAAMTPPAQSKLNPFVSLLKSDQ